MIFIVNQIFLPTLKIQLIMKSFKLHIVVDSHLMVLEQGFNKWAIK